MNTIPSDTLQFLDWFVFTLIFVLTLLSVWWGHRLLKKSGGNPNSPLELLLMGRQLTLPLFVCTLVATWYGGIFGVTELAFERGVYNFVTQGAFWYVTYLVFAFFLAGKVRHYNATGLPDLAGEIFGPKARKLTAVLAFADLLPIGYVAGVGIFIGVIFGIDWWMGSLIGLLIMFTYNLWGGFRAIVFSDLVQCIVMVISVWLVVIFCWHGLGGLDYLRAHVPAGHWDPTGGNDWSELFIWGCIALGTLVDPNFHQRVLAAKDLKTARTGILLSTVVWFFFDIATTLGGMYARAHLPDAVPRDSYLQLGLVILPSGLKGFFLAGILATILSTLDSCLFTASTVLTHDMFKKTGKWWLRLSMLLIALISWLLAPLFDGNVVTIWKVLGGLLAGTLLPPLVFGLMRPGRLSENGFVLSVSAGIVAMILHAVANAFWPTGIDSFYTGFLVTTAMLFGALLKRT